jgi:glycosyltransferase involved in cell wall biosynthesis
MRVGVYLSDYRPTAGGGYTFQEDLFKALLRLAGTSRHSFTALCASVEALQFAQGLSRPSNVSLLAIPKAGPLERLWKGLYRAVPVIRRAWPMVSSLQRIIEAEGVEIVWFLSGVSTEIPDVPYIATIWDVQHRTHPWLPEVSADGVWESRESAIRPFLGRAAWVITGTHVGAEELERFYQIPKNRIRILPHPTPEFALRANTDRDKTTGGTGLQGDYLVYPAQFWPHKNHVTLLYGIRALRERHGYAPKLVLMGSDKGNRAHVEQVALELGVRDQVIFPGFVTQNDLVELYRNAVVLVYVPMSGPENLPPLEAFAIGCPVIASDIPGAREQLGDAAILVPPFDPDAIADAIQTLRVDRERRGRLITAGLARARAWTGSDFVSAVFRLLDEFEPVRRCWPRPSQRL